MCGRPVICSMVARTDSNSSAASAALDLARSLLRTGERRVVELQQEGMLVNAEVLRYVNRLSDLLFMLARFEDRTLPFEVLTGDGGV